MAFPISLRGAANRSFAALLGSSFFASTGNAFTNLVIPLYVLETTGSATKTGLVAFANTSPAIVSAIIGGPLVDRLGRKRSAIASDLLSMATLACIPLLANADLLSFPLLLLIVAMGSVFDPPGSTARSSMVPLVATKAGYSPERAQSFFTVSFGLSQIIGPALAGISVAAIGAAGTIWINCGCFAMTTLLVGLFVHGGESNTAGGRATFIADLRGGWQYVLHNRFLRSILIVSAGFSGLFVPIYTVLYPVYFTEIVESTGALGLFLGMEAAGGLLGGIIYGIYGERYSRRNAMVLSLLSWLPFFWILLTTPPLWVLLIAGFLGGLMTGPLNPIFNVAFQNRTPEAMRARVFGIAMASNYIAVPLGALLIGPFIQVAGVMPAFLVLAVVVTILCVVSAFLPVMHELDDPPVEDLLATQAPV
jgi:MFS family permease